MNVRSLSRKEVVFELQTQILPRVANGSAPLIPAHPHFAGAMTQVVARKAPLLRTLRSGHSFTNSGTWAEECLNAARYPTFIWVAEGEADFRVGVTKRMAANDKTLSSKFGCYVFALPTHSFFLVPPGTPISDATRPHWERPHLEYAHSRLLWFQVVPAGITFHACTTHGTHHEPSRSLFMNEPRGLPLAEALLEESHNRSTHSDALARHYLMAFLLHLDRALSQMRAPVEEDAAILPQTHVVHAESTPTLRACRFIEANLNQKLLLDQICTYAYTSPTQLNRLFRAEMNVSVGEYIIQRRMEQARSLLQTTNLPINRIGVLCGYPTPEHFNRAFRQHNQVTPKAFRDGALTRK